MKPFTDRSALNVAYQIASGVCELLVGKKSASQLKYYLAAQLLGSLNGWSWETFKEMVEMADSDPEALPPDWNPSTERTTEDYPYDEKDGDS